MILALDAMGGDHAPQAVVDGALQALQELEQDMVIWLFGDEVQIRACLQGKKYPFSLIFFKDSSDCHGAKALPP